MNELAMIGMIFICGVIFYFTHDDEDVIELEGIPIEDLE